MLGRMIETERLLLRPLHVSDVDVFVELHIDPKVNRFVGSFSRQQALERLTAIQRQWDERGHGLCAIELKSSGAFIGRSGLQYWEPFDEVELGWALRADHWGHGYATEAAQACLDCEERRAVPGRRSLFRVASPAMRPGWTPLGTPNARAIRAPARPARARPTAARVDRNPSVHLLCRRVSPGICSANVRRAHEDSGQKNRRTRSRRTTRRPPLGTSAGNRR
ncbi:GNAT family N-acetyltransferase [Streptomyces griseofuscus]|uniref:GNAT family N-acetyltransferase n=1 Tax=Streptomyces griseofuscus TaxID=146922 RepID=UPI0036BD993C